VVGDKFASGTCPPLDGIPRATREGDGGFIARSRYQRQPSMAGVAGAMERR
jgi:hypothetical protein